jgi:glycosyltransferase involved in cell wall biosynthesis
MIQNEGFRMHKLKIAFLSAGTFTHVGPYLDFFKKRGHDVFLIAYDRPNRDYGVPTFDISHGASSLSGFSKWKYLLAGISIRKVLKEIKPDVLHGHYATSAGVISLISGFRPYALTIHGTDLLGSTSSFLWKRILYVAFSKAAIVNPVSEELGQIVGQMGISRDKILLATLGVDTECFKFQPKTNIGEPVKLLCTRSLDRVYDPETIIKACSILKDRQIPFQMTFAAGGPTESEVKMLVDQKDLTKEINFMSGYDNKSLPQLLHDHDFYLSASLWDGTSISLLEAMSCGIFPIVSRITSNQAWLTDEQDCFMFKCGDAQGLAEKIVQVINCRSLITSAVEKNRHRIEMRADRNTNMLKLEEQYCKFSMERAEHV